MSRTVSVKYENGVLIIPLDKIVSMWLNKDNTELGVLLISGNSYTITDSHGIKRLVGAFKHDV